MELDHIFMFIDPDGPACAQLGALGLTETYRRRHPGQGTENICFCFDNIFLECLWVNNATDIASLGIARTALHARSQWQTRRTSPFGLAWRDAAGHPPPFPTWPFAPPYLPPGMSIDVATDSDDPVQPMIFKSPGATPPLHWPDARRGSLQHKAGLRHVLSVTLHWPRRAPPAPALQALADATILDLRPTDADTSSLSLSIERAASPHPLQITLPLS